MASLCIFKILFVLSIYVPTMGVRAARSLDTDSGITFTTVMLWYWIDQTIKRERRRLGGDLRLTSARLIQVRSLQAHDDSISESTPAKKPTQFKAVEIEGDKPKETSWHIFSQQLLTSQMGSRPPNCNGKCGLCQPCNAVEVPISNQAVQKLKEDSQQQLSGNPDDTNYMPESWRCACGNVLYNP